MKNTKATEKYSLDELGILANLYIAADITEMFDGIMDERIASGSMKAENKSKAIDMISDYLDYVWKQTTEVTYYTLCELYDYLANGDLSSALHMVQKKSIVTVIA